MLPPFPTFLPFMLFAFVASITPGPTNILVLSNSARVRLRLRLSRSSSAPALSAAVHCAFGGQRSRLTR